MKVKLLNSVGLFLLWAVMHAHIVQDKHVNTTAESQWLNVCN